MAGAVSRHTQLTASSKLRAEGNTHYANAKAEGIAPFLRQVRYEESLKLYNKAVQAAENAEERSSACKNAAMANWKIAETMREKAASSATQSPGKETVNVRELYHWQQALLSFSSAKTSGAASEREEGLTWTGKLLTAMSECFHAIQATCLQYSYELRVEFLQRLQQKIPSDESCIWQPLQALLSEIKFNESVCQREAGGYIVAIRIVQSALQDINILLDNSHHYGEQFCGMFSMSLEAENALAEAEQQERICQAMQACALGDEAFEKALMMSDELSVELVWDAVDYFHHSLLLARNREVEQEAIAYSRLTKIFDRVLQLKTKAETYAKRTAELAEALMPRNLHTEPWYRDAMVVLERIRLGKQQQEESEKEEEMKKYKVELKDELEALNDLLVEKASRGGRMASHQEVLIHVYSKHPPLKFPTYSLPEAIPGGELKSLFKKALVHYHPDKVDKVKHGMKWFVLCSEITKILANRYERLK